MLAVIFFQSKRGASTQQEQIMLIDFGFPAFLEKGRLDASCGTLAYLAPEIVALSRGQAQACDRARRREVDKKRGGKSVGDLLCQRKGDAVQIDEQCSAATKEVRAKFQSASTSSP